ncbi:MAG: MerR family transcriptional regulator [Defluviitaleaceae bacterium]|nr:MerR family transcriptional regulator [Defluviitaleaceae bacterium]
MSGLTKIRDVSAKYGVSARTLRYYEDMGLISSTRDDGQAYRRYDEEAVKRLEQILILRKLNISIKDIQRVFNTAGPDAVLEALGKKVNDIDEEIALLHELKEIVIAFIRQIGQADFSKDSDVKLLYAKAKEIETQLVNVDYSGNPGRMGEQFAERITSLGRMGEQSAERITSPGRMGEQFAERITSPGRMGEQSAERITSPGRMGEQSTERITSPGRMGEQSTERTTSPSPVRRLFEVAEKLEEKAVSRLSIPDNVLKRLLQNVYFILGDGIAVADELGRRYGIFVYHTCEYRYKHSQNADPRFQPGLCRFEENMPDFFALDPEDAMRYEREVVHDYTPMVIMDLIQLSANHEKVICENDIDIDSIIQVITHAVMISNDRGWDDFIGEYENAIRRRDISSGEKEELIRKLNAAWGKGKPESPRGATRYGIKQIFLNEHSTVGQTADMVAEYFGLPRA